MRSTRNRFFLGIVQVALVTAMVACSDDEESGGLDPNPTGAGGSGKAGSTGTSGSSATAGTSAGGTSSSGSGGSGNTGTGNTGNTGTIPTEACPGLAFDASATGGEGGAEACTGVSVEAEHIDVDLFIMMDRSSSMGYTVEATGLTRWESLRAAVQDFVTNSDAGDIGAGLGFFSKSGIGNDDVDCDVSAYAAFEVPVEPLADVGAAMVTAIDDTAPAGLTPTLPALQGAVSYAQSWAVDHPNRAAVVVLVTDGYPTQCGNGPDAVAQVAEDAYASDQHVRTYVIGVGEVARFNLDNYARAGGTNEAYLTNDGDISTSFSTALLNITNSDLACDYVLPDPPDSNTELDIEKVQVVYTPSAGDAEEVPYLNGYLDCANADNGGWYYDNVTAPTKISVCPCTCARFGAGRVDVRLGCKPRLGLR